MKLPARVTICEVGTRDGFQIEPEFIPTDLKIEVVDLLSEAGVPRIEVTSFVHPKAVPQLRDAEMVMAKIRRRAGTQYAALVPNDKGAVRAVDAGVDAIHTVLSASESHNLANVNMTIAESLEKLRAVLQVAARARDRRELRHLHVLRLPLRGRGAGEPAGVHRGPAGRHGRAGLRPRRHHRHGQPAPGRGGPRASRPPLPRRGVDAAHPRHAGHGHSRTSWPPWNTG